VKRNFRIFSELAALLLGIGLLVSAGQNLARRRLPPELAVKLVPIAKPEVVNLGHLGGHSPAGGRVFDMQGVAIIDSPLDSTLAAYGQLIGRDIVRDPSLPERSVNFRGQASAGYLSPACRRAAVERCADGADGGRAGRRYRCRQAAALGQPRGRAVVDALASPRPRFRSHRSKSCLRFSPFTSFPSPLAMSTPAIEVRQLAHR
jgi:hypothetical protein